MGISKRDLLRTCPYCGATPAPFSIQHSRFTTHDLDGYERWWHTAACPACGGIILIEMDPGTDSVKLVVPEGVTQWGVGHLPDDVETHWLEAVSTLNGANYRSAVVACGRALEAASAKFGLDDGALFKRIEAMLESGLITVQFKEAMDYVRVIRNTGAHAGPEVEKHEAEGALGFTQQTLRLLFEVPGALAELDDADDADGGDASAEDIESSHVELEHG